MDEWIVSATQTKVGLLCKLNALANSAEICVEGIY